MSELVEKIPQRGKDAPVYKKMLQDIAAMTLKGVPLKKIARNGRVRMSTAYVRSVMKREEFKVIFEEMKQPVQEKVMQTLVNNAMRAADKIIGIMREGTPAHKVQFEAAKEVLYMIGVKPINVVETRQLPPNPAEVESARVTLTEIEKTIDRLSKRESVFVLKRDLPVKHLIPEVSQDEKEPRLETAPQPIINDQSLADSSIRPEVVSA